MLGKHLASLENPTRGLMQRLWGIPDIHTRQKWNAVWPFLRELPREQLSLLDAGCGPGRWALELAARRPGWTIAGIDADGACVEIADRSRQRLGLSNVRFEETDFFQFQATQCYDVVLSVCSAHTCAEAGQGNLLFRQFHRWLKPGGHLFLLVPRRFSETPFFSWLPRQHWQQVFARGELLDLCAKSHFVIEHLSGRIGKFGAFAKQIDLCVLKQRKGTRRVLPVFLYSFIWSVSLLDLNFRGFHEASSLFWLLIGRKANHNEEFAPADTTQAFTSQ